MELLKNISRSRGEVKELEGLVGSTAACLLRLGKEFEARPAVDFLMGLAQWFKWVVDV